MQEHDEVTSDSVLVKEQVRAGGSPGRSALAAPAILLPDPWETSRQWLQGLALPLWARAGRDARGCAWEELDLAARPLFHLPRRLRVQARQAQVYALAARHGFSGTEEETATDVAATFWAVLTGPGHDRAHGTFVHSLSPDGTVLDHTQDLYDLAFVLLAAAALIQAGRGAQVAPWLPVWKQALALHRAPEGWFETPADLEAPRLPRRQNPHMHLFEASLAAYEATGEAYFADIADTCLDLLRNRFLDPETGWLLEDFEMDLTPVMSSRQRVEPGHMVEWVNLLAQYARITGRDPKVDIRGLFDRALLLGSVGALPLLCDVCRPWGKNGVSVPLSCRLWPQTELLRASLVLREAGEHLSAELAPEALLRGPLARYLDVPVPGGWHDRMTAEGAILSVSMPTSSFYHVFGALDLGLHESSRRPSHAALAPTAVHRS